MRIEELLTESSLDEGPLSTVGKAVGNFAGGVGDTVGATIGGIRGVQDRFKQGFNRGRKYVNKTERGAQTPDSPYYDLSGIAPGAQQQQQGGQAPAGGQQAQAGGAQGQDPNQLRAQGKALIQQADELEKQQKNQQNTQQQNTQQQNTQQTGNQNTSGGIPTGSASNAEGGSNAPASTQGNGTQTGTAAPAPGEQQQQQNAPADAAATAGQETPADASATAKPDATPDATTKPGTTPPANNQQQQKQAGDQRDAKSVAAATKARLQGQRQAGTSMAKSGGNNFSNWVGGSPNYKGFDAQGNAIPNKIKREDMMFKSRFLEGWI